MSGGKYSLSTFHHGKYELDSKFFGAINNGEYYFIKNHFGLNFDAMVL